MGAGGQRPSLPIAWDDLARRAADSMDERAAGYVFGSAGTEDTARENAEAFRRLRIVPRMLRDVSARDLSTTLLGLDLIAPVGLAPIGVQNIVHPDGELAAARGAAAVGVPMCAGTVAAHTMEEIAAELGDAPRMFQLYWPNDPELAESFLQRAEAAGYGAIVVTIDNAFPGWKPRDLQNAYLPFLDGEGLANFFADPVFRDSLDVPPEEDAGAAVGRFVGVFGNPALTWNDLDWLRAETSLPIVLKGVLHPDDAREARERGVDGIAVSNHGGRQVDGAIAAVDALPAIADAVGDELAILFDSGIRSGADAVKALALGADAVLLGRPYLWGMALEGAEGVEKVLRHLLAELDLTMALSGCTKPAELETGMLVRRD
ncbi:MAG: alpha-hydroxy-acid oxidizing protein [Solirubrobacterales bacterium]|nr:alpha-hydroxy-acid oxidizing protein [Solirubrobacterales bacterium]MCB8969656.1 alpha-hydroxy-acid oxidizing protein [Thermoleophilales bacterium]MCO5327931.1 alpha-hydroxy-acid oxidizing protein [Solirubrobacterales bacterium]